VQQPTIEAIGKPDQDGQILMNFDFSGEADWTPQAVTDTPTNLAGDDWTGQDLTDYQAGYIVQRRYTVPVKSGSSLQQWKDGLDARYTAEYNSILQRNEDRYLNLITITRDSAGAW
jgi:hypothetical protein